MAAQPVAKPRVWAVVGVAVIGCAVVGVAAWSPWAGSSQVASVATGFLVNLGTAFVFTSALVFLEHGFLRRVERAATKGSEGLRQDVDELQRRVDTLSGSTERLLHAGDERVDRILKAVREEPSYKTITSALELANELGAFATGSATVQGGSDRGPDQAGLSMRVRFLWGTIPDERGPTLLVQVVRVGPLPVHNDGHWEMVDRVCAETFWKRRESAQEVGVRLIGVLQARNLYRGPETLEWGKTIDELARTIAITVKSRRGIEGEWALAGGLFVLVGDYWAITSEGIEHRGKSIVYTPRDVDLWVQSLGGRQSTLATTVGAPIPTENILRRAAVHLTVPSSRNAPEGWCPVPYTFLLAQPYSSRVDE